MSDAATPAKPVMSEAARGLGVDLLPVLAGMLDEPRWVAWDWVGKARKDGAAGWTKVPMIPGTIFSASVATGKGAGIYRRAKAAVASGGHDGVGWMLVGDLTRAWLDMDHCRDPVTGEIAPWALAVITMCGCYQESTPSGTGLRLMGRAGLDVPFSGVLRMASFLAAQDDEGLKAWGGSRVCEPRAQIEIYYANSRYVTVTGWETRGHPDVEIGGVVIELWMLAERQRAATHGERDTRIRASGVDPLAPVEDVVSALGVMINDEESWFEWSDVGMAAHRASGGDPDAFEAWRLWSEQCPRHIDETCRERWEHWRTHGADSLGFGTLNYRARRADKKWIRPSKARGDEFDVVPEAEAGSEPLPPPGPAARAFRGLAGRLIYLARQHRWLDTETRLLMDEQRLRMLAESIGVGGAQLKGSNSVAARLARRSSGMRQALSITMRPGLGEMVLEAGQVHVNVWRPSALVPKRGATAADCEPWIRHAERLIPDESDRRRVLDRMAWALQNLGKKINSAIIMIGGQGTGKDSLLVPFWAAIGEHNHTVLQGAHLGGSFNGYLETPWLLISEMPSARKRDVYEDIKGLLTTPPDRFRINRKGLEEYDIPNIVNVWITSNHDGAMALADDDRRGEVVGTVAAVTGRDAAPYYDTLHAWYAAGGNEAVAGYLLGRDVSAFRPHAPPPVTAAKTLMAREGAHPAVAWVVALFDVEQPLAGRDYCTVAEIVDKGQAARWRAGSTVAHGITWNHVLQGLRMVGWARLPTQIVDGEDRPRVWCRQGRYALAVQLTATKLAEALKFDRGKYGGADFG